MEDRIIFKVEFNQSNAKKNVLDLEKTLIGLKDVQKNLQASYKAGLISQEQYIAQNFELKESIKNVSAEQKSYQREIDLSTQANNANTNSYQELNASLLLAEKQLKQMKGTLKTNEDGTIELSEAYETQYKKVLQLKQAQLDFDQNIKNGKSNVGNYKSVFEGLTGSLDGLGVGINGAIQTLSGLTTSFKTLFITLLANPFILLATALAGMVAYFLSTEKGANKLKNIFAGFTAVLQPILSIISSIGEAVFGLVEVLADSVGYLASFFGGGYDEAKKLNAEMQKMELLNAKLNVQTKKNLAEQERLKNLRDDETQSTEERIKNNQKAYDLEIKRGQDIIKLKQKELQQLQKQLELIPENLRTAEQKKKILDKEAEIQEEIENSYGKQNEYITESVSLLKDKLTIQADIKTAELETLISQGKIKKGTQEELNARKNLGKERLNIELKSFTTGKNLTKLGLDYFFLTEEQKLKRVAQTFDQAKLIIANSQKDEAQLQSEFNEEMKGKYLENQQKQFNATIALLEIQKAKVKVINESSLKIETDLIKAKLKKDLSDTELTAQEKQNLTVQAEKEILKLTTDYKNRNSLATLEIERLTQTEGTKLRLNAEVAYLEEQKKQAIQNTDLTAQEKKKIEADYNKQISDLNESYQTAQLENNRKYQDLNLQQLNTSLEFEKNVNDKFLENKLTNLDKEASKKGWYNEQELLQRQALDAMLLMSQEQRIEAETNRKIEHSQIDRDRALADALQNLGDTQEYLTQKQLIETAFDTQELEAKQSQTLAIIDLEQQRTDKENELRALRVQSQEAEFAMVQNIAGSAKGLFKENTMAYKFFATNEALISTYLAASKALAAYPPPFGGIAAGIVTAQGLMNVAKINGVETFEKGGIFGGKPHSLGGTRGYFEDGTQIEVEKGELFAVVNKKNTSAIQNLSNLNSLNGNGVPFFQDGGMLASVGRNIINNYNQINDIAKIMQMLPSPTLQISELNKVEKKVQVVDLLANS